MQNQRRRDTAPEVLVRRQLFASGARFRVNYPVPGLRRRSIDVAFTRLRVAVFIDGCFWHECPHHGTRPRANRQWWADKLAANRDRDAATTRHLLDIGWRVLRFWEHEEPAAVVAVILKALAETAPQPSIGETT
jgi:DNA mismatch endonuclease (patch repair protein)